MFRQNQINISGQTYRKENQIGLGGQAVIYKGENIQTNEKVAIRIANEMTEDEFNIHQFLITKKKKFIIDIKGLEYLQENGTIIIVMELGKEDFYSYMKKDKYQSFTNLDKNLIFHQIVSAVDELHQLQYYHRDLKPENFILIENSNQNLPHLKLIDFGLCKYMHNNRLTQQVGTIFFMAPEIINSDVYNSTFDIWSLGCIYYEMMTKQSFLQGNTYQEIQTYLQNIQQPQIDQKIDKLVEMNFDEKQLLKRIMQKNANQRLSLKEILQQLDYLTKRNVQPIQFFNNFLKSPFQIQNKQFQNVPMQNKVFQPQILNQQQQQQQFAQQYNSFQNIQKIDQEISYINQINSKSETNNSDEEKINQNLMQQKMSELEQKLNQLRDNSNQMRQLTSILLQGCQEFEMIEIIQRLNGEIEQLNQSDFKLNLMKNQYEQIKDQSQFIQIENLDQQCREMEKQNQNQKQILNIINSDFIKNEKIMQDNLLNEIENKFNFQKHKFDIYRKEFQEIQAKEIDDCENKLLEIQILIKKIDFQKKQFCIKKQKQTFDQIKQKFEEFNFLYLQSIRDSELNKFQKIMKSLRDQKLEFESQISIQQSKTNSQNFSVDKNIQQHLQQQQDILNQDFEFYVQKFQDFERINNNIIAKDCQLIEFKKSLNELEKFYQESESQFEVQFQEIQSTYQKIEIVQKLNDEKQLQFNNLCQKVHQFRQQSKSFLFSKNISFCEFHSYLKKLQSYLEKYQEHFDKCDKIYQQNEKIHKELLDELNNNQDQYKTAKEQNLRLVEQIKTISDQNFNNLTEFRNRIFNKQKEKIKFIQDSSFYEKISQTLTNYQKLIDKVDSLDAEIQNYHTNSDQQDKDFYDQLIVRIDSYTTELAQVQQSLNSLSELDLQQVKNNFIRLILFLMVIQLYILNEIMQRQLNYQNQLKKQQIQRNPEQLRNQDNNNQKQVECQKKMIQYQNDQIKFEQFLSLNELQYSDEYLNLIEDNDAEIEKYFNQIFQNNKVKLRHQITDQKKLKKAFDDYCRTIEFSRFIILMKMKPEQ